MINGFEFEDSGRKYTCTVEEREAAASDAWWWFGVTSDRQRYAPFRAVSGDTRNSVQTRILEYYGAVLARRAMHLPYRPR
jgi:hypothetical protein